MAFFVLAQLFLWFEDPETDLLAQTEERPGDRYLDREAKAEYIRDKFWWANWPTNSPRIREQLQRFYFYGLVLYYDSKTIKNVASYVVTKRKPPPSIYWCSTLDICFQPRRESINSKLLFPEQAMNYLKHSEKQFVQFIIKFAKTTRLTISD